MLENNSPDVDEEFQKTINRLFVKSYKNKFDVFKKALDDGDIKLAHRIAHTLKSNAGQIKNERLKQVATEVESMLKDETNKVTDRMLSDLETELNETLKNFAYLLEEDNSSDKEIIKQNKETPVKDAKTINELLDNLEPLLKSGSPDCLALLRNIRSLAEEQPAAAEIIQQLVQQMEDFDFDKAYILFIDLRNIFRGIYA